MNHKLKIFFSRMALLHKSSERRVSSFPFALSLGVVAWSMKSSEHAVTDLFNTTAAMRAALLELLKGQVHISIQALADIAQNGASEAARVSAACAILDRTHGLPCASPDTESLH
jgi:hypothetical protein